MEPIRTREELEALYDQHVNIRCYDTVHKIVTAFNGSF